MHRTVLPALFLLATACGTGPNTNTSETMPANGKPFTQLIAFGDGLTDMGRWGTLTNNRYPPSPPFHGGRWTNGPVWAEVLAGKLGIPLKPELNFAMGGATTGHYNINEGLRAALQLDSSVALPGMLAQVEAYLASGTVDTSALHILWAGGHDIGSYIDYGQPDLATYPPAANYRAAALKLTDAGVRAILLGDMPDVGMTPMYFGTPHQEKASALCRDLNEGLDALTGELRGRGITVVRINAAALFADAGANPGKYGFKEVAQPYLPFDIIDFAAPLAPFSKPIPNQQAGRDPDEFMTWWAVSAGGRMHRLIADSAHAAIQRGL
jgi:phospholipase/lecithinase/hemolysin